MIRTGVFAAALALDVVAGDPPWSPHPVRAIGAVIGWCDRYARDRALREHPLTGRIAGSIAACMIPAATYAIAAMLLRARHRRTAVLEVLAAASTLAWRSLIDEASVVEAALAAGDLALARVRLARIVGRDTGALDEAEIARAVIETLAESLCDGIAAPLLYLLLGGAPLALAYKAINTLDSMIGHVEAPYRYFGWCAARVDDAANLLPARLSALAIAVAAQLRYGSGARSAGLCVRDARKHRSPNAGWPEAAIAGALGVRLGGGNTYGGVAIDGAVLGAHQRAPEAADVRRAMTIVSGASLVLAGAALALLVVRDARR